MLIRGSTTLTGEPPESGELQVHGVIVSAWGAGLARPTGDTTAARSAGAGLRANDRRRKGAGYDG
jgi:hypothetical protein